VCPVCKKKVFFDADICTHCGKRFNDEPSYQKKHAGCPICGSEIVEKTNFCPICGSSIFEREYNDFKKDPNIYAQKSVKTTIIVIIVVLFVSLLVGLQAYSSTVDTIEFKNSYNPNASFIITNQNFFDFQGHLALQISFITNANLKLEILNEYRQLIVRKNINSEKKIILLFTDELKTFPDGGQYTICVYSGSKKFFEETNFFRGPSLIIQTISPKWTYFPNKASDSLDELKINILNSGDMPAYAKYMIFTVDYIHGPYKIPLYGTFHDHVCKKDSISELKIPIDISDTFLHTEKHHISDVEILDSDGNVLTVVPFNLQP
jgi:DNA-directed RNA polymerase subunit RPC12/RpoP